MNLQNLNIGIAMCGSFCTFKEVIEEIKKLSEIGINITPVMSYIAQSTDTRFGKAKCFKEQIKEITKNDIIITIEDAEPIGPENKIDVMVIAPCTGNTLAKISNGITDSPVLMAAKAHLRNNKPLVIALATNDALGMNFENIGKLINIKNIYFVPFGQDDCIKKPKSMKSDFTKILSTIEKALEGEQIQPLLI